MSSTTASNRTGSDFVRLRDLDKREEKFDENIHALLEENGLYRKRIPKGPSSLLRAISDSLFYTQNQYEEVKESLISYLTQLVASNKLTPRLSGFKCNSMMLNDFVNNPGLPGFEKTILELVSLMHNARVVLYTMNEEHFLTATIFNSNFTKTIEFLRTKTSHYDVVLSKSKVDKLTYCQNIVLNMIEQASSGSAELKLEGLKDLNNGEFNNIAYENSLLPSAASPKDADGFRITRGAHKKSLSDNFNTNFEQMEEQQLKFLDAFRSAAPADDETFEDANIRKESGFSINANFDFMDEQNLDAPFTSEFAIKNYPVKIPLQTRNVPINETDSPMPTFSKTKFSNHPNVLFNENPSITEIERINSATTKGSRQPDASPYYMNLGSAPGLSPSRYGPQRTFSETSDFLISPTLPREAISPLHAYGGHTPSRNMPVSPFAQNYAGVAEQGFSLNPMPLGAQRHYSDNTPSQIAQQSQVFSPHHSQFSSLYMKRSATGASSSTTVPRTEEVSAFEQPPGLTGPMPFEKEQKAFDEQEVIIGYDQFGNVIREKRKPVVIDESKERFNGRLKFFDEHKKYGFIVMDEDGSDIFVHFDDLAKANVPKELLRTVRTGNVLRFNFGLMDYVGKYNRSRKAIEIQLLA